MLVVSFFTKNKNERKEFFCGTCQLTVSNAPANLLRFARNTESGQCGIAMGRREFRRHPTMKEERMVLD